MENERENTKCNEHTCRIGDAVLVMDHTSVSRKLDAIKARYYVAMHAHNSRALCAQKALSMKLCQQEELFPLMNTYLQS